MQFGRTVFAPFLISVNSGSNVSIASTRTNCSSSRLARSDCSREREGGGGGREGGHGGSVRKNQSVLASQFDAVRYRFMFGLDPGKRASFSLSPSLSE